ncbi:hypothetical protein BDR05DRAFT_692032 [Suillus weaverae]|nr:hypothetical protein BDR05DRAFT_692032 [Suillus weaverae]
MMCMVALPHTSGLQFQTPNFYLINGSHTGTRTSALYLSTQAGRKPHPQIHTTSSYKNSSLRSVHVHCYSWARTNGTDKVLYPFPWPATIRWWLLRRLNWDHYVAIVAEKWVSAWRRKAVGNILKCATVLTLLWSCITALLSGFNTWWRVHHCSRWAY